MTNPWERLPDEQTRAYDAFARYRDFGPERSTAKVAQALGKTKTLTDRWCARHQWVERARLYDVFLDQQARRAQEREILAFRKRAAQQARAKAQSLLLPDVVISQRLQVQNIDAALRDVPLVDLIQLSLRAASALPNLLKAEALALGDTTDRAEIQTAGQQADDILTNAIRNDADLRSLAAALIERAAAGESAPGGMGPVHEQGSVAEPAAPDVSEPHAVGGEGA